MGWRGEHRYLFRSKQSLKMCKRAFFLYSRQMVFFNNHGREWLVNKKNVVAGASERRYQVNKSKESSEPRCL